MNKAPIAKCQNIYGPKVGPLWLTFDFFYLLSFYIYVYKHIKEV
jgi:hypothetical protein